MKVLVLLFILLFGLLENESFPVRHLKHVSKKRNLFFVLRQPKADFNPFIDDDATTTVETVSEFDFDEKFISTVDEETNSTNDKDKSGNYLHTTPQEHLLAVATTSDLEDSNKFFTGDDTTTDEMVSTVLEFNSDEKSISAVDEATISTVDDKEGNGNHLDTFLHLHLLAVTSISDLRSRSNLLIDLEDSIGRNNTNFDKQANFKKYFPNDDEDLQDFRRGIYTTTKSFLPPADWILDGSGSGFENLPDNNISSSFNGDVDFEDYETSGNGSGQTNNFDDSESSGSAQSMDLDGSGSGFDDLVKNNINSKFNEEIYFRDYETSGSGSGQTSINDDYESSGSESGSEQSYLSIEENLMVHKRDFNNNDFIFLEENYEESGSSSNEETTNLVIDLLINVETTTKNSEVLTTISNIDATTTILQSLEYFSMEDIEVNTKELQTLPSEYVQENKESSKPIEENKEDHKMSNEIYKYGSDIEDKIQKVLASPQHDTQLGFHGINDDYYVILDDMMVDDLDDVNFVNMESESGKITEKEIITNDV